MGRRPTFDSTDAARAAREVFWQHGYEVASLPDLEAATGLRRSSIYHAFGSKRGLFDAAVENYLEEVVRPRLRPLHEDEVSPTAVADYFTGLRGRLAGLADTGEGRGCLLLNAAAAPIGHDATVRAVVDEYTDLLHSSLHRGVRARWPELPAGTAALRTRTLTALLVSALLVVRVNVTKAVEAVDDALTLWETWGGRG